MTKELSVVVISIIPFDAQGQVDEAAYRRHLRRLVKARCSVYVAGSSSSEAFTLTPEDLDLVLQISREELDGKTTYRAMGFEPRQASELVTFMKHVERARIGTAQIFSLDIGHGTRPSEAEMELYYRTIIDQTPLKIHLSCHPRSIGFALPIPMIERLCDRYAQITGIAYGGLDMSYLAELIARLGDRLEIHNAGPAIAVNTLALGGNGFMGTEGNVAPELVRSVIDAWQAKDYEGLRLSYGKLMRLAEILQRNGGKAVRSVKPILNAMDLDGGHLRPPRLPISDEDVQKRLTEIHALEIPGLRVPVAA
ncbi:dihydrodipicolinate synthase family protein [Frigidibacter sp. MR17.14]|uniref:dihydrodipicolinate synthase family protein n=1 Tax=Frigidibacter sp. MR17.14 TaxID=3126509 RepID=UPI003012A5EE